MGPALIDATPLALDSPRWSSLRQAYGAADDVPRLIAALAEVDDAAGRAELWFALWRMLWRSDAVFDAAYAAVPHLLALTAPLPLAERVQAMHLALRVELLRRGPTAPPMPADLVAAYGTAIESLPAAVHGCTAEPWSADVAQVLAAALLVGKRQAGLAGEVLGMGEGDEERGTRNER